MVKRADDVIAVHKEVSAVQKEVTKRADELTKKTEEYAALEKDLILKNDAIDRAKGRRNLRGMLGMRCLS